MARRAPAFRGRGRWKFAHAYANTHVRTDADAGRTTGRVYQQLPCRRNRWSSILAPPTDCAIIHHSYTARHELFPGARLDRDLELILTGYLESKSLWTIRRNRLQKGVNCATVPGQLHACARAGGSQRHTWWPRAPIGHGRLMVVHTSWCQAGGCELCWH